MRACAVEMHFNILQKITGKMPRPKNYGTTLCASMRRRNALQHVTRATVYGNLQEKCRAPKLIGPHFVRACAVEMHFNMSQEPLYTEILQAKCQNWGADFVRACAVETHVNISRQEPLYMEIYRKNAAPSWEHPDQAPAFTLTVRTRQRGHTVWASRGFPTKHEQSSQLKLFTRTFRIFRFDHHI